MRRTFTTRISSSRVHGGIPSSHRHRLFFRRTRKPSSAGVDFSYAVSLLDCGPKRHGRELLRRRSHVSTNSRTLASVVLRWTVHSSSFLHCVPCRFRFHAALHSVTKCDGDFSKVNVALIVVNFRGDAFDPLCFHPSGAQNSLCLDVTMKCESVYAYCCEFGRPCDCSEGITAAEQFPQTSSVVMWTSLPSEANHPWTF